jgi:2-oxoisovalerate dehydrogenase E2 component (dihydrolipoyl transacylase)
MASITMPQLGESVTEGTIAKWLKREGDPIAKYEPLVEVITDKVNSEIPSPEAGTVSRIVIQEGQTVKVGTEIAIVEPATAPGAGNGSGAVATPAPVERAAESATQRSAVTASEAPTSAAALASERAADAPRHSPEELRHRSSPLVRRLAKEHGVDLSQIAGSGHEGRVTKEDILAFIESRGQATAAASPSAPTPTSPEPSPTPTSAAPASPAPAAPAPRVAGDDEEVLPLSPVRRAIAEHMVRSVTTAPHAWTYVEVDASGLVAARAAHRDAFRQRESFDLTYVPYVANALVATLREHPTLNSTWRDGQVVLKKRIHLGVAVSLEDNLVVPVIHDADDKSVAGLARVLNDLVTRARAGQLKPDDVQRGTFTLNNTGALGSILSMPIINQPQAAILTMEAIAKRVVVTADDAIAVRPMLNLCLSFDHRICDGLQVMRFLQALKQRIESISPSASIY